MVYTSGNTIFLLVSLLTLTVFTHYMPPAQYGVLSILFFAAGAFTILLNLIPLAGILRWVWVAGEADSGAVDDPSRQAPGGTKRSALGTGCWMSLVFIVIGCGGLLPFSASVAELLVGSRSAAGDVQLAIASGAAGAVFRLTSNVVRMERRPVAFSTLIAVRPALALAVSAPLVISGDGVSGALTGTIVGSLICAVAGFVITRHSYSTQFSWAHVRGITDLGFKYILVIIGLYIVHNGDAFVMSRFTTHAAVGIYRVATRLAVIMSYLVSGFLQAWSPLERSALFQVTYDTHGMPRMHTKMITYFVLGGLTIVLGLGLSASAIVRLAPPSYRGAAGLVPFSAFFFVVYGTFVLLARTTYHQRRDLVHNLSAGLAAVVFVGCSALLVPIWGGYGLAVAGSIGMAVACVWFRAIVPRSTHHANLEWPRLIAGGACAIGCLALGRVLPVGGGILRIALGVVIFFVIYPAALALSRAVPMADARLLGRMGSDTISAFFAPLRPDRGGEAILGALRTLDPIEVGLLRRLIRDRLTTERLAAREGLPISVVESRAGAALRRLTGAEGNTREDAALGHWLFSGLGSAERDFIMYFLVEHGITMLTLHRLETASAALRALPARRWPVEGASYAEDASALRYVTAPELG